MRISDLLQADPELQRLLGELTLEGDPEPSTENVPEKADSTGEPIGAKPQQAPDEQALPTDASIPVDSQCPPEGAPGVSEQEPPESEAVGTVPTLVDKPDGGIEAPSESPARGPQQTEGPDSSEGEAVGEDLLQRPEDVATRASEGNPELLDEVEELAGDVFVGDFDREVIEDRLDAMERELVGLQSADPNSTPVRESATDSPLGEEAGPDEELQGAPEDEPPAQEGEVPWWAGLLFAGGMVLLGVAAMKWGTPTSRGTPATGATFVPATVPIAGPYVPPAEQAPIQDPRLRALPPGLQERVRRGEIGLDQIIIAGGGR